MIKDIKYTGYTAQPSDYECPDGQLAAAINVIAEDGCLKSINLPTEILTLSSPSQSVIFIHKGSNFLNYIIYDNATSQILWLDDISQTPQSIDTYPDISHCNAIGNTLIVFTDKSINYILWKEGQYKILGDSFPNINISFGLIGHPRHSESFNVKLEENIVLDEDLAESDEGIKLTDANKTTVTEQVMAKVNKLIREQTIEKGRFCFPFFVRYALRLYDGSLICHSAPILMNPSTEPAPVVSCVQLRDNKYLDNSAVTLVAADLDFQVIHDAQYQNLDNWSDIVKSIDVFISQPLYTYDQNGLISHIYCANRFTHTKFIGKLFHEGIDTSHNIPLITFPNEKTEDNIIGPVSGNLDFLHHYMEWSYEEIARMYFTNNSSRNFSALHRCYKLPEFSDKKIRENIESCSSFYKLHSISLEDAKSDGRRTIPIAEDYLQSLVAREVMSDDYLSHDALAASFSYTYNSRLNIARIKRNLFKGFPAVSMFAFCDRKIQSWEVVNGALNITVNPSAGPLKITVYVNENGKKYALSAPSSGSHPGLAPWGNLLLDTSSWGSYIFYPNANAYKVVIHDNTDAVGHTQKIFSYDMKPHDFLNGAICFLGYNKSRTPDVNAENVPAIIENQNAVVEYDNKIYTSEINNPFLFPVTGINTIGAGKILNICSAAKALSEGQFGQFPLYAFTDEGVWALEVSSTGSYSARQPITRDVILENTNPLQMDSAVLFATDRGIMLISGSQTQCITDAINAKEPFDVLKLPGMTKLHSMLGHDADTCLPTAPFLDFISECGMLYDYVHQRVIVYNPIYTYAYVYSLKSKEWGMMYSTIEAGIHSYPEALAVDHDGTLLNFSSMDGQPTKGLFVTRPLKLETPDVLKTMDTVIQRGYFKKGHVQSALYGSRDLFNWHLIWSSKDHFLRGFRGTPYKYFRIACVASLSDDESIFGASLQFTPRQTNQPR